MPGNNIELITKYSTKAFDEVYKQESVTAALDVPNAFMEFTGAKTVKIRKFQTGGLNSYSRNNNAGGYGDLRIDEPSGNYYGSAGFGYKQTSAKVEWEERTLKMDRAAAIPIEYFDNEEAGGDVVSLTASEFMRTVMVPENDAYTLSTIAANAGKVVSEAIADNKALAALNSAFLYFEENEVPANDQIIFASPAFMKKLRETTEMTRFLGEDVKDRKVNYKITNYEGRDIITVSPQRLHTGFKAYEGGYGWEAGSAAINFLAVAKSAVVHIKKFEQLKIVSGDMNLAGNGFDGYTIYARMYYDVFVLDNKKYGIYASISSTAETAEVPMVKLEIETDGAATNPVITKITTTPPNMLCFVASGTNSSGTLTSPVLAKVGDKITTKGTKFYAITSDKKIISNEVIPYTA